MKNKKKLTCRAQTTRLGPTHAVGAAWVLYMACVCRGWCTQSVGVEKTVQKNKKSKKLTCRAQTTRLGPTHAMGVVDGID